MEWWSGSVERSGRVEWILRIRNSGNGSKLRATSTGSEVVKSGSGRVVVEVVIVEAKW